jgi:AAA15 family ATPase/GTPase
MNDTFFKSVHITNFKSLKDVTLSDCKRINLLIGKPNVGKSNILEAIGLFSLPYLKYNKSKKITQFVRLENIDELFFDGNIDKEINIRVNENDFCNVSYFNYDLEKIAFSRLSEDNAVEFKIESQQDTYIDKYIVVFDNQLNTPNIKYLGNNYYSQPKVKYYKFPHSFVTKKQSLRHSYLIPPIGVNLLEAIQANKIEKELSEIFIEYGLNLLFDKTNNSLRIMKALKADGTMVSFPFSSIADTLQRLIFFKTAIASNKDSILLFEEPEAHCFPPYISHFTQEVIYSESNQFFIATHSPYVLNDFLENKETRKELAIFFADFKDGQTIINRLSDEELSEIYNYGIDVFFNYQRFTN